MRIANATIAAKKAPHFVSLRFARRQLRVGASSAPAAQGGHFVPEVRAIN